MNRSTRIVAGIIVGVYVLAFTGVYICLSRFAEDTAL
jgi:hypothetical protein